MQSRRSLVAFPLRLGHVFHAGLMRIARFFPLQIVQASQEDTLDGIPNSLRCARISLERIVGGGTTTLLGEESEKHTLHVANKKERERKNANDESPDETRWEWASFQRAVVEKTRKGRKRKIRLEPQLCLAAASWDLAGWMHHITWGLTCRSQKPRSLHPTSSGAQAVAPKD